MVSRLLRAVVRWLLVGCWLAALGLLPSLLARAREEVPVYDRPVIVQTRGDRLARPASLAGVDRIPRARPASLESAPPVRLSRLEFSPAGDDDGGDPDGGSGDGIDPGIPIRTNSPPHEPPTDTVGAGQVQLVVEVTREPTTTISPSSTTPNQTTSPTVAGTSITSPGDGGDDGELSYTGVGPLTWLLAALAVLLMVVGAALRWITSGPGGLRPSMLHGAWADEHTTRQSRTASRRPPPRRRRSGDQEGEV